MISANTSGNTKGRIYNTHFRNTRIVVHLFSEATLAIHTQVTYTFVTVTYRRDAGRLMCRAVC
jgi:hypothetical protein